tara:strand:- start:189 stop:356 length:168 start_codon:yes stop_codon:yes gene_type:complete
VADAVLIAKRSILLKLSLIVSNAGKVSKTYLSMQAGNTAPSPVRENLEPFTEQRW